MYCAWRIPAHLRCTQCSILLHLMDICFLTCICLWQISQIQTFLFRVVGPGLVSTSLAFVSNSASHPAGPHAQKTVNRWGRGGSTQFAQQFEFAVTAPPLVGCVVWSQGGGLITYIKSDTTFTHIKTPQTINTDNTETQLLKIHTKHFKDITIANIYIAPRNTATPQHDTIHYGHRHNKLHTIHHQHT